MDGYGAPFYYDYQNAVTSMISPNTVHCKNTGLSNYFARYLLQKAMSVFEFHFPETWAENYLLYVLYCWGRFAIFNTDRFGVVAGLSVIVILRVSFPVKEPVCFPESVDDKFRVSLPVPLFFVVPLSVLDKSRVSVSVLVTLPSLFQMGL